MARACHRVRAWATRELSSLTGFANRDALVILTSPFSRTRETAEIVAGVLDDVLRPNDRPCSRARIEVVDVLRERDAQDPTHRDSGVECAERVQSRATRLIKTLEQRPVPGGGPALYHLVSHGDTLKILQTGFLRIGAGRHADRQAVTPFGTAEMRELELE